MTDIAVRFAENPLLSPNDLKPSIPGLEIACLLNPGVFRFRGKTWLIVRVAERPAQKEDTISFPVLTVEGGMKIMEIAKDDPGLDRSDPRVITYNGAEYLATLSHLRLLCSEDNIHFYEPDGFPTIMGRSRLETFGVEDCRVGLLGDTYYLTYTAVSDLGVGVGLKTTRDWKVFRSFGMMLPPHNKDCAIFEEKVNGKFYALHRPSSVDIGGNYIWLAESPDGIHWGNHRCLLTTRPGKWDSARVGAGASPIRTEKGWLVIYHGANEQHRYCLGAFMLDLEDPSKLTGQADEPIMVPAAPYELSGFFGQVVFTNGHIRQDDGDTLTIYYGAADEYVCAANFSLSGIISKLIFTE